jgi:septal ring factor EnvC (AmiA/AmiB activator)
MKLKTRSPNTSGNSLKSKAKKNTLQNKVNQLKKQQATLNLQIQATTLQINAISVETAVTETQIEANIAKSADLKKQLVQFIRSIYQQDNDSLLFILLSQDNLSDALTELENSARISEALHSLTAEIADNNQELSQKQDTLARQRDEASNLLSIQSIQRGVVAGATVEQSTLLD